MEKRDHDAVHATVAAVDTVQYRSLRSMTPEIPSDVCVHVEKKEAGMMDSGQDQLESSSAGTGLETLGQQCPPNGETWETGRTIADGYLLVNMGSGRRHFSAHGTRWYASRYRYGTGKFIEQHFSTAGPKTQRQDMQRREQAI